MSIERPRRYYLQKRRAAVARGDIGQANVWQSKQEAEPGTSLAASFPARAKLVAAGYVAVEDVDGATEEELVDAGLTARDAKAALAALESS